jgi:hypothetical protein
MYKIFVAIEASILSDSPIAWFDLDRLVKIASGKCQRMQRSVVRFGEPFSHKRVVWQMAIVASRDLVMAGFLPGIKMGLHDMAVGTSIGVVHKIRHPSTIVESEQAQPKWNPNGNEGHQGHPANCS